MTREWSLLVTDQEILDLVHSANMQTLYILAGRFVAILDAIKTNDLSAIDEIGKESRAAGFRKVVAAIKRGLAESDAWSAGYTARAVIADAFRYTPAYLEALDAFSAALRQERVGRLEQ